MLCVYTLFASFLLAIFVAIACCFVVRTNHDLKLNSILHVSQICNDTVREQLAYKLYITGPNH